MDETLHLVERLKRKLSAVTADGSDQVKRYCSAQ